MDLPPSAPASAADNLDRRLLLGAAGLAGIAALAAGRATAGPLNPPAGAVVSSGKTLTEVEPRTAVSDVNTPGTATCIFRISQAGSYYLTGNVQGVAGKNGIEITASGVTLDLNGFQVNGVAASSLVGILISAFRGRTITIKNGAIRNWGGHGLESPNPSGHPASGNAYIHLQSSLNGGNGFTTQGGSVFDRCTAVENGVDGYWASGSGSFIGCTAYINTARGFNINGDCSLTGCCATANGAAGFYSGLGSTFGDCTSEQNAIGFETTACTLRSCNAYLNDSHGFILTNGVLSQSVAMNNSGDGVRAGSESRIADCSISDNDNDGLWVSNNCLVTGNVSHNNGVAAVGSPANIRLAGSDNRVEGNNCTDAPVGIVAGAAGNVLFSNTCSGNTTNWSLVANNVHGPIIDRTAPASAAVSGNSALDSSGSTHPRANFSF
ncbi:MAG: hypothetical protein Q8L55_08640 [Phycisphaerales bacterium]|nr:hypothetical protein [Phycisphaerales bacterium]